MLPKCLMPLGNAYEKKKQHTKLYVSYRIIVTLPRKFVQRSTRRQDIIILSLG